MSVARPTTAGEEEDSLEPRPSGNCPSWREAPWLTYAMPSSRATPVGRAPTRTFWTDGGDATDAPSSPREARKAPPARRPTTAIATGTRRRVVSQLLRARSAALGPAPARGS